MMSTRCYPTVVEGVGDNRTMAVAAAVAAASNDDALSPVRIHVPHRTGSGELSGDDDPVTTPEASTDSENDSSFENELDEVKSVSIRKKVSPCGVDHRWPGCTDSSDGLDQKKQQRQQQVQNAKPIRQVRFALQSSKDPYINRRIRAHDVSSEALRHQAEGRGTRHCAATMEDTPRLGITIIRPGESALQPQKKQQRRYQRQRSTYAQFSNAVTDSSRMARKKRIIVGSPFKSTSANINAHMSTEAAAAKAAVLVRGKQTYSSVLTPTSPRKRKISVVPSSTPQLRARDGDISCCDETSGDNSAPSRSGHRSRARLVLAQAPSVQRAAVAAERAILAARRGGSAAAEAGIGAPTVMATETATALSFSPARPSQRGASAVAVAVAAGKMRPPISKPTPVDLSCSEELDVDAAMKPKGEARIPICRFLLPCWPEGVEGYEEVGGWRRLGGIHTRENFPRGRRCI